MQYCFALCDANHCRELATKHVDVNIYIPMHATTSLISA